MQVAQKVERKKAYQEPSVWTEEPSEKPHNLRPRKIWIGDDRLNHNVVENAGIQIITQLKEKEDKAVLEAGERGTRALSGKGPRKRGKKKQSKTSRARREKKGLQEIGGESKAGGRGR